MHGLLLALLLTFPDPKSVGGFTQVDGGITTRVWCDGVPASTGGTAPSYVNALIDGGSITVNNFPVTQPISGTLTCNVGTGTQPVSGTVAISNPVPAYVNALIDGGYMTVTVLNPTGTSPAYVNALLDGGWTTVTVINRLTVDTYNVFDGGAVSGNWLTDTQARATPLNVTVTNYDAGVWITSMPAITGTITVSNPDKYVNVLVDGGFVTAQITNPVSYINTLVDGGWITATILNPTPSYTNTLIDGGWTSVTETNPVTYVNTVIDGGTVSINNIVYIYNTTPILNPFLLRCNKIRTTRCNP